MKTKKIVRLILIRDHHILLIKKLKKRGGIFALIGGKVEKGETLVQAMIRESYEEAGLVIQPEFLRQAFSYSVYTKSMIKEYYFFQGLSWEGKIEVREPEKFEKLVWQPLNSPPEKASPDYWKHINTFRTD